MKTKVNYSTPLTLTSNNLATRQELSTILSHILIQAALNGIDLTTYEFDNDEFDFDYIAFEALADVWESSENIAIIINKDKKTWDLLENDQILEIKNFPYKEYWETKLPKIVFHYHFYII